MSETTTVIDERVAQVRADMLAQIGHGNILAISGGRYLWLDDVTVKLPISNGYSVEVEYDWGWDTYTVRRVFTRSGKRWVKGEVDHVYFDQLADTCWRAHAFRSYEFGS